MGKAARLCLLGAWAGLVGCADGAFKAWSFGFEEPELEREGSRFVARLLNGWCGSPEVQVEWELDRWRPAPVEFVFREGNPGLWVGAIDRDCHWYAAGCSNVDQPVSDSSRVYIELRAEPDEPRCAPEMCQGGYCLNDPLDVAVAPLPTDCAEPIPRGDDGHRLLAVDVDSNCAVRGGQVWCWGRGDSGQLGNGAYNNSSTPVQVQDLNGVDSVAVGRTFACALSDGTVFCWGSNSNGQLGNGTNEEYPTPGLVSSVEGVAGLAAAGNHVCVRTEQGAVYCWGDNQYGQAGGDSTRDVLLPAPIEGVSDSAAVIVGSEVACSVNRCGQARCWGANWYGERGDGDPAIRTSGGPVVMDDVVSLALPPGSSSHACAVVEGLLWCWGANWEGQLGDGTLDGGRQARPVQGLPPVRTVAVGDAFTCAVTEAGGLWCWGKSGNGRLAHDGTYRVPSPTDVSNAVEVATGDAHGCLLDRSDQVWCWGSNSHGRLGVEGEDRTVPALVQGLP